MDAPRRTEVIQQLHALGYLLSPRSEGVYMFFSPSGHLLGRISGATKEEARAEFIKLSIKHLMHDPKYVVMEIECEGKDGVIVFDQNGRLIFHTL